MRATAARVRSLTHSHTRAESGRLRINIAATAQKLTPFYLGLLRRVLEGSRTPLLLRFFPALSQEVQRQTLKKNVIELLGLRAEPGQARPPADPLGLGKSLLCPVFAHSLCQRRRRP